MSVSGPSSARGRTARFLSASALTGSALGLVEATWIGVSQRPDSLASALEVLWFASVGYLVGCFIGGMAILLLARRSTWMRPDVTTAIAWGAACCAALVGLSLGGGMGAKKLTLLALGAITLSVGIFRLITRLLARLPFRFSLTRVLALHLAVLAGASLALFGRHGHATQQVLAAVLALTAVALAALLLRSDYSVWQGVLCNAAAVAAVLGLMLVPRGTATSGSNLLLITVDTLRADRLGTYGHARAHTPNLDRLAVDGFVFENALSSSPRTGPSHTSILTGLYPQRHAALSNRSIPRDGIDNLPTRLGEHGFATGAIVSGWTLRSDACGLNRYFQSYDDDFSVVPWLPEPVTEVRVFSLLENLNGRLPRVERPARVTTDAAQRWLRQNGSRRFFLWVHYFDPHVPYDPPREFERLHVRQPIDGFQRHWYQMSRDQRERLFDSRTEREYMKALYSGEVSYVDSQIGRLLDTLEEMALADDTITVLTADHGETLDEHRDFFAHDDLYQTSLRVPLLVRLPGAAPPPRRLLQPVWTVDLAPTLLELLGIEGLAATDGMSFAPLLADGRTSPRGPSLASLIDGDLELYSVFSKPFKLIWKAPRWFGSRREGATVELYDLDADPAELDDLAVDRQDVVDGLRPLIDAQRVQVPSDSLSAEERDKLRSLGYLN